MPLINEIIGDVRNVLFALFAVALLVLLIACATTASLVSIRLEQRAAELVVRRALGAGRARITLDVALEVVVLAALAALGGLLLAYLMIQALQPLATESLPRARELGIDTAALIFAAVAATGSAVLRERRSAAHLSGVGRWGTIRGGCVRRATVDSRRARRDRR